MKLFSAVRANIIVDYAAADQLSGNAWSGLVKAVWAMSLVDTDTFLKTEETEYGRLTSNRPLPSTYRSAKAVVRAAKRASVSLVDVNNAPLGKTAVEKAVKAFKGSPMTAGKAPSEKDLKVRFEAWLEAAVLSVDCAVLIGWAREKLDEC